LPYRTNFGCEVLKNELINTVIYGSLQTDLNELMKPKLVGELARSIDPNTKALFELHRQFPLGFIRPNNTVLHAGEGEYLMVRGTTLAAVDLRSNVISMAFGR